MPVHLLDDICPDGVRIVVSWKDIHPGMSVFIPCINSVLAKRQIAEIAERHQMKLKCFVRVENNNLGLRVWRTA